MGLPHLHHFGKLLFPELVDYWHGFKTMKSIYAKGREMLTLADGTSVLLMLHPSFWHAYSPELKARAIEHLAAWASEEQRERPVCTANHMDAGTGLCGIGGTARNQRVDLA